jgi:hypothetical protein
MYAFTSRHNEHDAIVIMSLSNQDTALAKMKTGGVLILGDNLLEQLNKL